MKRLLAIVLLAAPLSLAVTNVSRAQPIPASKQQIKCLADNIYYEARNQPLEGKIAVAQVTINRMQHKTKFKSTLCSVVHEPAQFSWTLNKRRKITDEKAWNEAYTIAVATLNGYGHISQFNALYYHTDKINPYWSVKRKALKNIGAHVFYA